MIEYFTKGKVNIVAGRPGMGKTSLLISLLRENHYDKKSSFIFSLQHIKSQLIQRLSLQIGISQLSKSMILIEDEAGIPVEKVCSIVRQAHTDYILIDDIHLMTSQTNEIYNIDKERMYILNQLRALAKNFDTTIICSAMLCYSVDWPNKMYDKIDLSKAMHQLTWASEKDLLFIINRPGYFETNYINRYVNDESNGRVELGVVCDNEMRIKPLMFNQDKLSFTD